MATLFGREPEVQTLSALFDSVHERGGALVVRGEAGVGKSALLAEAKRSAEGRGFRVLTTTGVQTEAALPYAGLHQLLRPVLSCADELPPPQRDALRGAFGMDAGEVSDLFLVGLATLNLLSESAARTPLLLLIDDSHWLDRSTSDVLAFVARRLEADPVVMLVTVRDGNACSLVRSVPPEIQLKALAPEASAALLDAHAPGLAPSVRARVLREAAGNPLALTELPAAIVSAGFDVDHWIPSHLPLTSRLERAFAVRLEGLPESTRLLLLVAAADDGGHVHDVLMAASALANKAVTLEDTTPAVAARLLEVRGSDLLFGHPLIRSTIYQTADLPARQAAHRALANALTGDPDRRTWHRAAAVLGPDDEIAEELEAASVRARRRGATTVAATTLERAAAFSNDHAARGRCLVAAAGLRLELGQYDEVIRLLDQAQTLALRPRDTQWLMWYRELIGDPEWTGAERSRAFVEIADQLRLEGDIEGAISALQTIALRCYWSNPERETRDMIVRAAERIPVSEFHPKLINVLALVDPERRGGVVLDRLAQLHVEAVSDAEAKFLLGYAGSAVDAFDVAIRFLEAAAAELRAQGRLGLLAQALVCQAWCEVHFGNWSVGRRAAEEAARLALETAQPLYMIVANLAEAAMAAYRGDTDSAEALVASGERVLLPLGASPLLMLVQYPRGVASLVAGHYEDAYEHLRRIFDPSDTAYHPSTLSWTLMDLVEAAVHCGRREEVQGIVSDLERSFERTRFPLLGVALRFARPLLAPDDEVETLFLSGLDSRHGAWPFQRARLRLAYGTWLRRHRRVADSKVPLREARDAFDALGAVPWGERARQELRATGESNRSQSRTPDAHDALTPQELQIAQMAARGMSNKEIGEQLYLSHRTVGSHLYRLFPKLGITARSQLRDALESADGIPS